MCEYDTPSPPKCVIGPSSIFVSAIPCPPRSSSTFIYSQKYVNFVVNPVSLIGPGDVGFQTTDRSVDDLCQENRAFVPPRNSGDPEPLQIEPATLTCNYTPCNFLSVRELGVVPAAKMPCVWYSTASELARIDFSLKFPVVGVGEASTYFKLRVVLRVSTNGECLVQGAVGEDNFSFSSCSRRIPHHVLHVQVVSELGE